MNAEDWGEFTGQILFEVVQDVATAGAGAYITGLKVADKTIDVVRAADKLHYLDNAIDTAKALDKIEDVGDGIKIAEEIGDVKYLDEVLDPPGTFRDPNGRLRNENGTFAKDSKTKAKNSKKKQFLRNMKGHRKALLRDAENPNSGLSKRARKQILDSNGNKVPKGYEVSHEKPLYNDRTDKTKKALDIESNMKTQQKAKHRKRHKRCGNQYHEFGPANKPKFYFDDIEF